MYMYKRTPNWGPKSSGWPLGNRLEVEIVTPESASPSRGSLVLNWGVSAVPRWVNNVIWLNHPSLVAISSDKKRMTAEFNRNKLPHLESITLEEVDPEALVVARTILNSHSGIGIVITKAKDAPYAPLYTLLEDFDTEYRYFVVAGCVVSVAQKKRMGREKLNSVGLDRAHPYIKSHRNGWVFAKQGVMRENYLSELAVRASEGYFLTAVDMGKRSDGEVKVIEINTAPGITSLSTLEEVVDKIRTYTGE